MKYSWFIVLFYVLYISLVFFGKEDLAFYIKPFLVPSLLFLFPIRHVFLFKRLFFVVLFSTLGDVLLMFNGSIFFILGLSSFLIAHLIYVLIFWTALNPIRINLMFFLKTLLITTYFCIFLSFLWPYLGPMKAPVFIYAAILSIMLWFAIHSNARHPFLRLLIILGALSFAISDSMLSTRLFYGTFKNAHFFVMSTYLFAQFLMVYGILEAEKKEKSLIK